VQGQKRQGGGISGVHRHKPLSQILFGKRMLPYMLLAPALLVIGGIILYPLGYSLYLSLTNAHLLRFAQAEYVGLENYERYLTRPAFWRSLWVTVLYTLGTVVLSFSMGLVTALMLNVNFRFRDIARGLIAIPWATPWLVVTLIWYVMFNPQMGPVNEFLKLSGVIETGVPWLYQRSTALLAIILVTAWRLFPAATLLILAGLQSISKELYDAAKVDGAGRWQQFRFITMPSLRSVNLVVVVLMIIWTFTLFTIAFTLTAGGPGDATNVLSVFTYQEAFMSNRIGRASALATLSVVLSLVLVGIYFWLINREERGAR
jgi:multiple sugar transport system permease protein